jgi:hypothetical protein
MKTKPQYTSSKKQKKQLREQVLEEEKQYYQDKEVDKPPKTML